MLEKYKEYLSSYETEICDQWCGEEVAWGRYLRNCPSEIFLEISNQFEIFYSYPEHIVITRVLTRQEAIEMYGEITEEVYGVRGGWKTVQFGNKKFKSKFMKP